MPIPYRVPKTPTPLINRQTPYQQPLRPPSQQQPQRPQYRENRGAGYPSQNPPLQIVGPSAYTPPSDFMRNAVPPKWGQTYEPNFGPAKWNRWQPDYQPTYWEKPLNIARHYWQMKNMPPGEKLPDWIDPKSLDMAYRYMEKIQGTSDWANWKYINPDDPGRQWLQTLQSPSLDYLMGPQKYQQWVMAQLQSTDPDEWTPELMDALSPDQRQYFDQSLEMWKNKVPFEDLPVWQQVTYNIQQNPMYAGMATMAPFAAMGFAGGAAAGVAAGGLGAIPGALLGAGIPLAIGAGLGLLGTKVPAAAELLGKLDVFAEGFERAAGVGLQIEGAWLDPEIFGSLEEVTQNLPAAWKAASLTYELGAIGSKRPGVGVEVGLEGETGSRTDITNIFPAIEYAWRYITSNNPDKVQFAGGEEVFPHIQVITDDEGKQYAIGDTGPVQMDVMGLSALVQARRRMLAGEDPNAVINEYVYKYGFSAEFANLAGHIALDPLNILPKVSARGVAVVARVAGDIPLQRAFQNSHGLVEGFKQYGNFIRQGMVGDLDELSATQLFIGGLNAQGLQKSIDAEYIPTNPLNRAWMSVFGLRPDAKARMYTATMGDNLSGLLDFRRSDFLGQLDLFDSLRTTDNAKLGTIEPFLASSEFRTMKQSLASFGDQIQAWREVWDVSAPSRGTLLELARFMDTVPEKLLLDIKTSGVDNLVSRISTKLNGLEPEAAARAAERFSPDNVKMLEENYLGRDPLPWHPDEAAARLWGDFNEHNMNWAVQAYGVKPNPAWMRFFDTMKRAQSIVLLGFNPAYAINNGFNNMITRAASGNLGYHSTRTIQKFITNFGMEPYRFHSGIGASQAVDVRVRVGESAHEEAIGRAYGAIGETGEEILRAAQFTKEGPIRKGLNALNEMAPMNRASAAMERMESAQSYYVGIKQFMDNNMVRGKGVRHIDPTLRNALEQHVGRGTSENIIRILETSLSKEEVMSKLFGEARRRFDPDMVIHEVFKELGVDEGIGRGTLGAFYDDIKEQLARPDTTIDDVSRVFEEVKGKAEEYLDAQLAAELQTRAEQVASQSGGGGLAEAMRIFIDHDMQMSEFTTQHFKSLDETWIKEAALRAAGASQDLINSLWRAQKSKSNKHWRRARNFERASMKGILEGFGLESADARRYVVGMEGSARLWDEYYEVIGKETDVFYKTKFDTSEAKDVAYHTMQDRFIEYYDQTLVDLRSVQKALDDLFVEMNRNMYGDEAATASRTYRDHVAVWSELRAMLQQQHRKATVHEPVNVRRAASRKFFNEEYLPFIDEFYRQEIEAAARYGGSITGDVPAIEFTRPVPGGAGAGAEVPPARSGEVPPTRPEQAPPQPPVREAPDMAPVFDIARKYGISSAKRAENGTLIYDTGAKPHILNVVRQFDPSIKAFEEITPEIAKAAFEAREAFRKAGVWGIEVGDTVRTLTDIEGVVVARMKDSKSGMPRWKIQYPDGTTKIKQGMSVQRVVPLEEAAEAVQPPVMPRIDPDEYKDFLRQAGDNNANLARIIDSTNRAVDENVPFKNQTPGEYWQELDNRELPASTIDLDFTQDQTALQPYGPYAPGVIENILQPQYDHLTMGQGWAERVMPLLDALEEKLVKGGDQGFSLFGKELPESVQGSLNKYLEQHWRDLTTHKIAAVKWGENLRDQSLLNYSQQRNFDPFLQVVFPYEFWFTRSMYQWAQRAIDRPAWFANYARLRRFMEGSIASPGFPSRLANKIAIPAPYLPEWAGSSVWVDPIRKMFPFSEFTGPVDYYAKSKSEQERRAENLIIQWHGRGQVGTEEASQAFGSKSGATWQRAMEQAQLELEGNEADTGSWMNMIMSPALYLTMPAQMLLGKNPMTGREDTTLLPMTRTGNALKAITENTPLHMVGQMFGSILAAPETMARRAAGVSEFGDWGEYYIERQISNMVSEGQYDAQDAIQQMIEKQGPAYEEAVKRVQLEQAFSVPGSTPIYAALHGATFPEFMSAMAFGWLPAGLLPEGELAQRGLAEKYKHAREQYNLGEDEALSRFFDENPQLEARLALWDEPEERMRQFLITEVWNQYSDMSGVDKQTARDQFGDLFQQGFLSDETRNYDLLDIETLAYWSNSMGGKVPYTEQTSPMLDAPDIYQEKLQMAPPLEAAAVDAYRKVRGQQFPNWYALQNMYFSTEKPARKAFLTQFPELVKYWDWNRDYKAKNPVVEKYTQAPAEDDIPITYDLGFIQDFTPGLTRQLFSHYYAKTPISGGTLEELRYLWNMNNRPGGDFETFLNDVLKNAVAP